MSPLSAPMLPGMSLTATHGSDREKLAAAAKSFEAIFIRQMLGAARKTSFGEGLFGSQAMQTFRQMQDEKFADIAAERGAFGMARLIEAQLVTQTTNPPPLGEVAARRADGGGKSIALAPSASLRSAPPPKGED